MRDEARAATAHLLSPLRLGALALLNRIVAADVVRCGADEGGTPQPRTLSDYAQAGAAAGLVIAEPAWVTPQGTGALHAAGMARDAHVTAWSEVTDAVHAAGGRIALPLWHAGRLSHPRVQPHGGWPVAPSAIAASGIIETRDGPRPFPPPRELDATELPALRDAFATAAGRALRAGFDAVEIHAADGGLLDQFLDGASNHREDAHGGSIEGRARLLIETIAAVRGRVGADRVGVRLSTPDPHVATLLAGLGLAWLHVVVPVDESVPRAAAFRRAFGGPVILGGAQAIEAGSAALAEAAADAVVLARSLAVDAVPRVAAAGPMTFPGLLRGHWPHGIGRLAPFLP